MAKAKKNRFKTTSVYVTVSLSLILFLLLIFGSAFIQSNKLFNKYKEQIEIDLFFRDATTTNEINQIEKELALRKEVKSVRFVPKEEAWEMIKDEVGGDFAQDVAEGNPLYNSINLTVKESFANLDSVENLEKSLLSLYDNHLLEVYYNKAQFKTINESFYKYMLYFLVLCALLITIAVILINNTIRLAIFSKRFLIRTMQLVGAKNGFIKRPFLVNAIFQGIFSGILAILFFIGASYLVGQYDSFFKEIIFSPQNLQINLILFGGAVLLGIFISFVSTSFSVNRYLRVSIDKLYRF